MYKALRSFLVCTIAFSSFTVFAETFQNPRLYATSTTPLSLLHGDLNGDGHEDLVYSDNAGTLHVLLGSATGALAAGTTLRPPGGSATHCTLHDYNGDHKLDLACVSQSSTYTFGNAQVYLMFGNGDGTFATAVVIALPYDQYAGLLLMDAGDLNGDGAPDLMVIDPQRSQQWPILSDGHGGLRSGTKQTSYGIPALFADVNGDGKSDELYTGPAVAIGNGDGSFAVTKRYSPAVLAALGCTFADIDADGHLDAVCGYYNNSTNGAGTTIAVQHGNPDGSFSTTLSGAFSFGDNSRSSENYGSYATPTVVADFNGDGILDILGYGPDGATIYYGKGALQFAPPVHFTVGESTSSFAFSPAQVIADLNGDGLPDIIVTAPQGILISFSSPGGKLATASAYEATGVIGYAAVADFNGDGIPDVIATGDFYLGVSLGKGDGTFAPYSKLYTGGVHWEGLYQHPDDNVLVHGDFNGDGKEDLIAIGAEDQGSFNESYYYLQGNGDGTFKTPVKAFPSPGLPYIYGRLRVADFNGDGKADVISAPDSYTNTVTVHLSQGNGVFVTKTSPVPPDFASGSTYSSNQALPAVADFDEDGKLDIVTAANNAIVLRGNGDGTFGSPLTLAIPGSTSSEIGHSVITGDFDGDGHKDFAVLFGGYSGGGSPLYDLKEEIVVYYGKGDGTFSAPVVASVSANGYAFLAAADLNKDGRDEIVAFAAGTLNGGTAIGVLHGSTARTFAPLTPYVAGFGLENLEIADLNHDGFPDLIFSNEDYNGPANSVTVLLNLGNVPTPTGTLIATPEPSTVTTGFTIVATLTPPPAMPSVTGSITFTIDGNAAGSAPLNGNAASVAGPTNLTIGTHQIVANWPGDTNYPPVSTTATHTVVAVPLSISLTSTPNPSPLGQPVTFTTTFVAKPPSGSNIVGYQYTGTLTFYDGPTIIKQQQVSAFGYSFTTSALVVGSHSISAVYSGDAIFSAATSNTVTQVVLGLDSVSTLTINPISSQYGTPVVVSAVVSSAILPGSGAPKGTVTFTLDGVASSPSPLNAASTASATFGPLSAGNHVFTCSYSGDTTYNPSVCSPASATVTAAPTTLSLISSANPGLTRTPITFTAKILANAAPAPTGSNVTFSVNGQSFSATTNTTGTATYTTTILPPGVYSITATFAGTSNYIGSTAALTQTVTRIPTTSVLAIPGGPMYTSTNPITLTAVVTPQTSSGITGTVSFYDGATLIGNPTVGGNGSTTLTLASVTAGTHTYTCAYSGDSIFAGSSCGAPITINVVSQDFTITSSSPTLTVQTGHHNYVDLNLTSIGSLAANVSIDCTKPLPAYVTCELPGSPVALTAGGTATTRLTIDTNALLNFYGSNTAKPQNSRGLGRIALASLLPLALLALSRRRRLNLLSIATALLALTAITGCSGQYPPSTPSGTYTIPINAYAPINGLVVQHSINITLVVTN